MAKSSVIVNDIEFTRINKQLQGLKGSHVKAGFPSEGVVEPSLNPGDDFKTADDISEVASIAAWQEFGTTKPGNGIPERPFMRTSFQENQRKYARLGKMAWEKVLKGQWSIEKALDILGMEAQADIQEKIVEIRTPANRPSTIAKKKGADNPLIHFGQMLQSVQFTKKIKGRTA